MPSLLRCHYLRRFFNVKVISRRNCTKTCNTPSTLRDFNGGQWIGKASDNLRDKRSGMTDGWFCEPGIILGEEVDTGVRSMRVERGGTPARRSEVTDG